jgi:thiol-disulfide isomerase/thioredoxin
MTFRLIACLPLLLLAACGPAAEPGAAPAGEAASAAASSAKAAPAAAATTTATPESTAERPVPEHPALVIKTFDGGTFDLSQHRGRWVVVNFWATWCNPCLKEIPDLAAMDAAHEEIDVIGLAFEEIERGDMEAFLAQRPIPYPIAVVDTFGPPTDFGIPRGLPTTFLIAPDGKVAATHLGPVTSEDLLKDIAAAGGKLAKG